MNNFKKIGPYQIDWHGIKSVLIHGALLGLGYVVTQAEAWIVGHNFGNYQFLVMGINSMVFKLAQKFFTSYGVPIA